MAGYVLKGSYSTTQSLGAGLSQDVQFCTIETSPSDVIASMPVSKEAFNDNQGASVLTNFSEAIEQIMALDEVVGAEGAQIINTNGSLDDQVVFTVTYTDANTPPGQVTADAPVGVNMLNFSDAEIGRTLLAEVEAIITGVYNNLKNAASG